MKNRSFNLVLCITCLAGSAAMAGQGKMVTAIVGGLISLMNFAIWVALAPDEPKTKG